jgi:hypothetical protein
MPHQLIIRLTPSRARPDGAVLTVEYPDLDTAEAERRCMERFRQHRWGLPSIYVQTVEGVKWCLSYRDIVWPVELRPAPQGVPAS